MKTIFSAALALALSATSLLHGATNSSPVPAESRLLRPLSLAEAIDIALQGNSDVRRSLADLEAAHGIVVQTRAIALPRVRITSDYTATEEDAVDRFRSPAGGRTNQLLADAFEFADQRWSANVRLVQSIYEGGRIGSALRVARLTREQALLNHQAVIGDVLRDVRIAYHDVLLARQLISVQEASLKLLQQELDEMTRRYKAGTVPRFNVLRAEVEVANARPRLIRARNALRIAKDALANLLGENIPPGTNELPLKLTGTLDAEPMNVELTEAVQAAFAHRAELQALRKAAALRAENVVTARAGYKPSVQVFGGYGARSSQFSRDLLDENHGWEAGAQLSWDIFDGFLTRGRVMEARALERRSIEDIEDAERRVELDVRTAYSGFVEAREVLESQEKVQEAAEEALRLATARAAAGTATQLDVLSAQTALTEARSTQAQALRDYAVARARLTRAIGQPISTQ